MSVGTISDEELIERVRIAIYRRVGKRYPSLTHDAVEIVKPLHLEFHEIRVTVPSDNVGHAFMRLDTVKRVVLEFGVEAGVTSAVEEFVKDVRQDAVRRSHELSF